MFRADSVFSIHMQEVNNRRVFQMMEKFLGWGSAGGYEVVVLCNSIHSTSCLRLSCGCSLIHYFPWRRISSFYYCYFLTQAHFWVQQWVNSKFLCVLCTLHIKGDILIIERKKNSKQNILFWHQSCEPRRRRWATNRALLEKCAKHKR